MADYSSLGLRVLPYTIRSVEGGFAPRGRRGSGFPIGPIGTGRAAATAEVGTTVERDVGGEDRQPRTPTSSTPSSPSAPSSITGYAAQLRDAVVGQIESQFAFPTALNPLTGTVRATGVSPVTGAMMPGFFGPLMELGYKMNMDNLSRIAGMSQVNKDYSTALMGNQLVGVKPTADTLGGKIASAFGFNVDGYTLSGNISGFTNVDMAAYKDALVDSLLAHRPTAYGPGRAVAMGLNPQVTYSQVNIDQDVASRLGIDPFSPSDPRAFGGPYAPFVDPGAGRPDPTRPGGIVGSVDPAGNWTGVTSGTYTSDFGLPGMIDFAFHNMGPGYSAKDMKNLEGTGGTDFSGIDPTGTSGAFTGDPVGMGDEYDDGRESGGGGFSSADNDAAEAADDADAGQPSGNDAGDDDDYSMGGHVKYAPGGNVTNGFINKDPDSVTEQESIADNRFTSVKEGSFIVNQPTNEKYEGMLDSLVAKAEKKVKKPKDAPMVDVALSDGERHIEPEVVAQIEKIKGKGFLDKLNDKGKSEVQRRQAKYGGGVGLNEGGIAEIDRGFVSQLVGPDSPEISGIPTSQGSGFLDQPPPSIDDDLYFDRRFGDIKSAIQTIEIKGFEDNPYIFTGIKRKKAPSSAFGPMQITASTLKDIRDRSKFYKMLGDEEKQYMNLLIQQGDDKINIEKYRAMYRDGKKITTPDNIKKLYGRYGTGQINPDLHKKHYETIANITLMQKLQDHDSLQKALASYGEGPNYATKVLRALK
tara:strand:- start:3636 stop:5894 length:2259 start_codon:yes stop_codon:yes gene_type:complete